MKTKSTTERSVLTSRYRYCTGFRLAEPALSGRTVLSMILLFLSLSFTPIHAQGFNLSLSPPLLQATIKPGKSISQVFTIYNNGTTPISLTPKIVPFIPEDNQGNPSLQPQLNPTWLQYFYLANSKIFFNKPFILPANQSDQLVLGIKVPEDAPQADHYVTLLVSSDSSGVGSDSPGVARQIISGSIGANILLTVSNQAAPPTILNITELQPTNTQYLKIGQTYLLDNLSPIQFTAKLENLGEHLSQAHGLFQILQGTRVNYTQPFLPVNVLAHSTRELTASSSGDPRGRVAPAADPAGLSGKLVFHPKLTHIGPYQAKVNVRSENGSSQNSINLILLPIKALIGLTLSLILLKLILKKTNT